MSLHSEVVDLKSSAIWVTTWRVTSWTELQISALEEQLQRQVSTLKGQKSKYDLDFLKEKGRRQKHDCFSKWISVKDLKPTKRLVLGERDWTKRLWDKPAINGLLSDTMVHGGLYNVLFKWDQERKVRNMGSLQSREDNKTPQSIYRAKGASKGKGWPEKTHSQGSRYFCI